MGRENYVAVRYFDKEEINKDITHLYAPNLEAKWGIHVVQEVKILTRKVDHQDLDTLINELIQVIMQREIDAKSKKDVLQQIME